MTEATNPIQSHDPNPSGDRAVVSCAGLTKIFRDFWFRNRVRAVDSIDLQVHHGEVLGLLGPNGSGKSTTIKMMLGLLHPTAGRVSIFGKPPDDVATKKRVGYLPEESYLYRFLNARETLAYYASLFHLPRSQRQHRIDELLHWVGLEHVQRRPVGEYSKGMQRKIGLAQALINAPDLLILDEPTSGMDPVATREFKDLILRLKNRGRTVLLCSHLLADVEDICDRVAIMYGGQVQREGTVEELLTQHNMTTIHTEQLDASTINEIEAVLAKKGKHIDRVEQPRERLESLFLDIVHQAKVAGAATSGAVSGGQIAGFLVQGEAPVTESDQLIDKLVKPKPSPQEPIGPAPQSEDRATSSADQELIAGLTDSKNETAAESQSTPPAPGVEGPSLPSEPAPPEGRGELSDPAATAESAELTESSASPKPAELDSNEQPDQGFIDALSEVPEEPDPESLPDDQSGDGKGTA